MPDEPSNDHVWDEYQWERFLQQQDQRTQKYMELLDRYMDDPQRDEIIAREMGWNHMMEDEAEDWENEVDAAFEESLAEIERESDDPECDDIDESSFHSHPLYIQGTAFITRLMAWANENQNSKPVEEAFGELCNCGTVMVGKLAAALSDEEISDLGMTIAYLKRALHAANTGLGILAQLQEKYQIQDAGWESLRTQLFGVRDGIITLMGEQRAEFRRRYER